MNVSTQNPDPRNTFRHWFAWIVLCIATTIHVVDEALTNILDVWNPAVLTIRQKFPFMPLPTFTFEIWLTLIIFGVISMFGLSVFVWQGRRWTRPASYAFAGFMLLNGILHIAISFYAWQLLPGVYSSPLLIVASVLLILYTRSQTRSLVAKRSVP